MNVHFNNPELQAKVDQWVSDTGRPAEELLEDSLAGYFDELAHVKDVLDSRYDDVKSGKVKLVPLEEVRAYFREKSADPSAFDVARKPMPRISNLAA